MKISTFGDSHASLYTLQNSNGMEVTLSDIGAVIVSLVIPNKDGVPTDVCLGYEKAQSYFHNNSAYGAIVGRFANRIGGAAFALNGVKYQLDCNEGKNVLHGGFDKYFDRMWYAELQGEQSITLRLISPDGDQGMPGRADISVTYSLDEQNNLTIDYNAVSDKDTVFNLTNHCYFNLDGHDSGDILEHRLWLDCDKLVAIDSEFIPTGEIMSVKGTAMDFTTMKSVGRDIDDISCKQICLGNGYDHNYIINNPSLEKPFARLEGAKSGIVLEVLTDRPGVQVYSGNNMGSDSDEKGGKYPLRGGFCLETQFFPDSPNQPDFPCCVFKAGHPFISRTVFRFSVS